MLKKRIERLLAALPGDFEAALIQTEVSRFYLLDFDAGDAGVVVLLPNKLVYIIDSRYIETAQKEVQNAEVVLEKDRFAQVAEVLKAAGVHKVHLETGIPLSLYEKNREKLPGFTFDISNTLTGRLEAQRAIKDEEEQDRMRKAQAVTDACFEHILPQIQLGAREVDLMLEMERFMRSNGAEKVAFDTIFVAGPNGSQPHGVPGHYTLQKGDLITLDFGARYKGYCSDMTRTVALGEPGEEKREIYALVLKAHMAGLAAVKDGCRAKQVDATARDLIKAAGFGEYFGHGLGHSVGIEIHEDPRFAPSSEATVHSGMMMTIEPGVYLPGRFGCRIEDTVLVTADGCSPLPKSPKKLIVL